MDNPTYSDMFSHHFCLPTSHLHKLEIHEVLVHRSQKAELPEQCGTRHHQKLHLLFYLNLSEAKVSPTRTT